MPAINTIDRRAFLSTGASLVATGASFMILPKVYAATGSEAQPSPVQRGRGETAPEIASREEGLRGCAWVAEKRRVRRQVTRH